MLHPVLSAAPGLCGVVYTHVCWHAQRGQHNCILACIALVWSVKWLKYFIIPSGFNLLRNRQTLNIRKKIWLPNVLCWLLISHYYLCMPSSTIMSKYIVNRCTCGRYKTLPPIHLQFPLECNFLEIYYQVWHIFACKSFYSNLIIWFITVIKTLVSCALNCKWGTSDREMG